MTEITKTSATTPLASNDETKMTSDAIFTKYWGLFHLANKRIAPVFTTDMTLLSNGLKAFYTKKAGLLLDEKQSEFFIVPMTGEQRKAFLDFTVNQKSPYVFVTRHSVWLSTTLLITSQQESFLVIGCKPR